MKISKSQGLDAWNGNSAAMAKAIGITASAVSMWKEALTPIQADRVIAAAWRENLLHNFECFKPEPPATPVEAEVPVVGDGVGDSADERSAEGVQA